MTSHLTLNVSAKCSMIRRDMFSRVPHVHTWPGPRENTYADISRICTRREKSPGESISCETTIPGFLYCPETERMKNMKWGLVVIAAVFEVVWVTGLKHADSALTWSGTITGIIISFYLLIKATDSLPVGTVYAVFTGLGTAGTVLSEILLFKEQADPVKIVLIGVLLIGVIGLKLVTQDKPETKEEKA